ncbi:MAG: hypothetical protein AAGE61_20810 [Pseudomonadota bacterium]
MRHESNRWGIVLNASEEDEKKWRINLRSPFDPFVEEVEDETGTYFVVKSSSFHEMTDPSEVYKAAQKLFRGLNAEMLQHNQTNYIWPGSVVEFLGNQKPRKIHIGVGHSVASPQVSRAEGVGIDVDGNVKWQTPGPSQAQLWAQAAYLNSDIESAMAYIAGNPDWTDLFKAYEALEKFPKGNISKKQIQLFTHTANTIGRHHNKGRKTPPEKPMSVSEGRRLILRLITAAIDDTLESGPERHR